jgi:signal transduction histidine kinase
MANGTNIEQLGASGGVPQLDNTVQYNEHYQQLVLAYQKVSAEKQYLESFIAMMAHQFRSPLQSIEYNVEYQNNKKGILESVWTMSSLLEKMSLLSKKPEKLRKALSQDMQGECTLTSVLEKSLSLAFTQLLTINNRDKIIQHYLLYAKKTGQVSKTTTRKQWRNNDAHLVLWKQLQTEWETSFMQLSAPDLFTIVKWAAKLFPIEINGFDDNSIHFQPYEMTESIFIVIMTEMIVNAIKYYYSETEEAIKLSWIHQQDICRFTCENPTSKNEQEMGKGSYQGHNFLKMISKKSDGHFSVSIDENKSIIHFDIPTQLLIPMEEI